jgi:hypothetical protein
MIVYLTTAIIWVPANGVGGAGAYRELEQQIYVATALAVHTDAGQDLFSLL